MSRLEDTNETLLPAPSTLAADRNGAAVRADGERGAETPRAPASRRPMVVVVAGALLLAALVAGGWYYLYAAGWESTDDAFIEGRVIQMSPKVAGHVVALHVDDNQDVKQGDLLVEIDPRDFQARVAEARANLDAAITRRDAGHINVTVTDVTSGADVEQASAALEASRSAVQTARAQLTVAQSQLEQARAQVIAAQAEATRTRDDQTRMNELFGRELVARQDLDHAVAAAQTADAQRAAARAAEQAAADNLKHAQSLVAEAQAKVRAAVGRLAGANAAPQLVAASRSQAATLEAQVEQARAALEMAELQLAYTKIYAPAAGRITRRTVERGAYVQVGQALCAIVPFEYWVIANFKETQLTRMRPGQPVEIRVDAYPGRVFRGHVDSIQSGAGARFSLLPPENATGNYVKVVQRVPVKILFDTPPDPAHPVGPGMSVVPSVKVK
jgi:membrane fusion protein (multidrug efflux system)